MDLAGSEPYQVSAAGASVITQEIDSASARIVFRSGCIADVTASRVSDEKKRLLRVFDGEAVYTSDYQSQKAVVSRKGGDLVPELLMSDISTDRRDTLGEEVRAFVLSIRTGTQPLVSGSEGRRALALAQKITENIHKGITEFVPAA
jgi:predicted dehydrogenase